MLTMEIFTAILLFSSINKVDPRLVEAIIKVESNFNTKAIGSKGEVGLMQLYPKYHRASFNVNKNIAEGTKILAFMKKSCYPKYGDAWFVCYNLGTKKVLKHPKKFKYYKKVMTAYEEISNNRRGVIRYKSISSYAALSK